MSVWRCCVLVITAAQLHSTITGLGFKEGSNTASICREFSIVKISGNSASRKKDLKPFVGQSFDKNNSSSSLSHLIKRSKDPPLLGTTYFIINGRKRKMMLTELSQTQ